MGSLRELLELLWLRVQAGLRSGFAGDFWLDWAAVLSILIFSVLLYQGYRALVASGAQELFYGILSIGLFYALALLLHLEFLLWLLDKIIPTLLVILAVVLQPELRKLFVQIGRRGRFSYPNRVHQALDVLRSMLAACEQLVRLRRGALIVFCRENMLSNIIGSGTILDARPSYELVTSLFAHDTLLHDGAVIVREGRVRAASCVLPIAGKNTKLPGGQSAQNGLKNFPKDLPRDLPSAESQESQKSRAATGAIDPGNFGTRHRAAIELASDTDAVVLVVSEESGRISLAFDGRFAFGLSSSEILETLQTLLIHQPQKKWSIRRVLGRLVPFYGRAKEKKERKEKCDGAAKR